MVAGIYLIINKKTGQKYVGGSKDIERRIKKHISSPNNGSYIDNAIQKYGFDSFDWQVIEELSADWEIIGGREEYWVSFYNTFEDPEHYNLTKGGEGISGWKHTKEAKEKMSKNHADVSGKNNGMWRKKHTPESCKKISESLIGHEVSNETRKKLSENHADVSKENNPNWKDYGRIIKSGKTENGIQRYRIQYNGQRIMHSTSKEKLYERWYKKYPDIELIDETI